MARKGWEEQVKQVTQSTTGWLLMVHPDDAVKLLARQHACWRTAILKYRRGLNYGKVVPGDQHARGMVDGAIETCNELLAALGKMRGGR